MNDARQHGIGADRAGLHFQAARAVDGAAGEPGTGLLRLRRRLAGEHGLVDRRTARDDHAVDRNGFAWTHAQPVAHSDGVKRHVGFGAVGPDAPRGLGREVEQGSDRSPRRGAGAQFQHLAEQH